MANPRIYIDRPLQLEKSFIIEGQAATHIGRVLRMNPGQNLRLFNGDGHEYNANIEAVTKRTVEVLIYAQSKRDEPIQPNIHLGQVISKGDRMDFTLQKATELGVTQISPLTSERCDVRLKQDRLSKKMDHWKGVIASACEQSGRNTLPIINPIQTLEEWCQSSQANERFVLHPHNTQPLNEKDTPTSIDVLVGPEGGFSENEIHFVNQYQFRGLKLGPRILRTETAALTAISIFQYIWGDFR